MIEHAATKIGLIGLGNQGLVIAAHLADCGVALALHDKNPVNLANAGTFFEQTNVLIMADTKQMLELGYTIMLVVMPKASREAAFKDLLATAREVNFQDVLLCSGSFAPISHVTANLTPEDKRKCCGLRFVDLDSQDGMVVGDSACWTRLAMVVYWKPFLASISALLMGASLSVTLLQIMMMSEHSLPP